ncbi:MAG: winged helix-turn-helix domain-containing protein [Candidatus Thorarchaeota archaeon]
MGDYEEWNDDTDTLMDLDPPLSEAPPVKEFEFVSDEERARELDDPVRLAILQILRRGIADKKTEYPEPGVQLIRTVQRHAMSVVEIVNMSKEHKDLESVTKNQVYHHLPKLKDHGYITEIGKVTVVRDEKTEGRTTTYYRRTAKGFVLVTALLDADEKLLLKKSKEYNNRMLKVFAIDLTDEEKEKLVQLRLEAYKKEVHGRAEVAKMIRSDVADKDVLNMFDFLVTMYAMGSDEYIKIHKMMRDILFK